MAKPKTLKFDASARLQSLLGRELISNEYVAMAEIVRNAYDAGAKEITIRLESGDPQRFIITDNGKGMSVREFEEVWMTPGFSHKAEPDSNQKFLGEKGIGRFAVDKIASRLIVTTKIGSRPESIRVNFNWDRFADQNKKLRDVPIRIMEVRDKGLADLGHGTRLELSELRKQWRREDWEALRGELAKLIAPSGVNLHFKIFANSSSWSSGELVPKFDGTKAYQYFFSTPKKGQGVWTLTRPDEIIKRLGDAGHKVKKSESGSFPILNSFGPVKGQFYFFDKPSEITKQGFESGVAIYRDGFRVEPYGRADEDWVEVKLLKSKRHGKVPITPSRLFGYVEISRAGNPGLRDLTNREGIQESSEFSEFRAFVIEQFLELAGIVGKDKEFLPTAKSITAQKRSTARETKSDSLARLADELAHQLKQPLTVISFDIATMEIHLKELAAYDEENATYITRIHDNVARLDSNITDLRSLAKDLKGKATQFELVRAVRAFIDMHVGTFAAKGIELRTNFEVEAAKVKFSRPVLHFVLDNFLTNALKATVANGTREPVLVGISKHEEKFRVWVQDSGVAVPAQLQKHLFDEPITSSEGWGKGLYSSNLRVEPFSGLLDWYAGNGTKTFFLEIS